jgi:predicted HAD superfamily Cof-like phosphohydrolase
MTNFEKVKEFHRVFGGRGATAPSQPTLPNEELKELRLKLIDEEVAELKAGLAAGDIENVAKELADILYVVYGMGDVLGIDLDVAFEEVQRSNMSKLGEDGNPVYREDGKILKGPNYSPADMSVIWKPNPRKTTVTIYESYYNELVEESCILHRLWAAGVDNWEGYEYALEDMEND